MYVMKVLPPHKQRKHAGNKNAFKIEGKSNFTVKIIPNSQQKKKKSLRNGTETT